VFGEPNCDGVVLNDDGTVMGVNREGTLVIDVVIHVTASSARQQTTADNIEFYAVFNGVLEERIGHVTVVKWLAGQPGYATFTGTAALHVRPGDLFELKVRRETRSSATLTLGAQGSAINAQLF
ncbi:Hypothetical protein POVN_LOCUS543, partial [uncultured virus]